MHIAIIVSAGKGSRINSNIPKQFIKINNKELLCFAIEAFEKSSNIDKIVLVTLKEYISYCEALIKEHGYQKVTKIIEGGTTRQESVRLALNSVTFRDDDIVLIHDGDRPFVSEKLIDNCIKETKKKGSAVPLIKEIDSRQGISNSGRKIILDQSFLVQTPQCFFASNIVELHNRLKNEEVSDDASILEKVGRAVNYIDGDKNNFKVTLDQDLKVMKEMVNDRE